MYEKLSDDDGDWLEKVHSALEISVNNEFFPDLFNPFLFEVDGFDHALAAFLNALLVTDSQFRRTIDDDSGDPYWWSGEVESLLVDLAERQPNLAEQEFLRARDRKKPNRLGVVVDRTPSEIATLVLQRTSLHP
jgi:hypothetical protein